MKVLLVSPVPPPASGIASWTVGILRELASRGDVEVTHVDTAVRWRSTNDARAWKRLIGGTLQALRDTVRVVLAIRKARPAVIHLCTSGSLGIPKDILILLITHMMGVRSVLHYRRGDLPEIIGKQRGKWLLMRWAMLLADTVLLLDNKSEISAKAALSGSDVQRIPNPIDSELLQQAVSQPARKRPETEPVQIVFAGWVVATKGVRELVEACRMIVEVPFELNIIGNVLDDFRNELERIALQRDGGNWLKFHGMLGRAEAFASIGNADLFVLPSYTEGFPNVVTEAMTLGRPIIATRVGAIPDMLDDGTGNECGMLISPQNVYELRAAMLHLLTHPEEADMYGSRAQNKAMTVYSMASVINRYISLWDSLQRRCPA